jgi:hypothetical protein
MRAQDDASGPTRALETYDDRALRRLRHKDLEGLVGLMDDYQSLADELEEIGTRKSDPGGPPTRRRAA